MQASAWNAARVRGRLVANPTENPSTGTYPYGGTELGEAIGCSLVSLGERHVVRSEALGAPRCVLEADFYYQFRCVLRGHDDDAWELLLAHGSRRGFASRHVGFSVPGNVQPGQSTDERGLPLLLVPANLVRHDALMIYQGVPSLADDAEVPFDRAEDFTVPLVVDMLLDSRRNMLDLARIHDITLSP